jgi:hypothetical protein
MRSGSTYAELTRKSHTAGLDCAAGPHALERQYCDRRHVGYRGYRRRDGPADCCAIARLSELNRSGARFLTPVSRASADLTQCPLPDRRR